MGRLQRPPFLFLRLETAQRFQGEITWHWQAAIGCRQLLSSCGESGDSNLLPAITNPVLWVDLTQPLPKWGPGCIWILPPLLPHSPDLSSPWLLWEPPSLPLIGQLHRNKWATLQQRSRRRWGAGAGETKKSKQLYSLEAIRPSVCKLESKLLFILLAPCWLRLYQSLANV